LGQNQGGKGQQKRRWKREVKNNSSDSRKLEKHGVRPAERCTSLFDCQAYIKGKSPELLLLKAVKLEKKGFQGREFSKAGHQSSFQKFKNQVKGQEGFDETSHHEGGGVTKPLKKERDE